MTEYLYHGTTAKHLPQILCDGITTRREHRKTSNWKGTRAGSSHLDFVYLTDTYPFFFSMANTKKSSAVVFEIEMKSMNGHLLYPDEDFILEALKQQGRKDTTLEVSRQLLAYNRELWQVSLDKLGTVSYLGSIPAHALTRYVTVDFDVRKILGMNILDPTISVINKLVRGQFYQELLKWFFGDTPQLPQVKDFTDRAGDMEHIQKAIDFWTKESADRTGITVTNLK